MSAAENPPKEKLTWSERGRRLLRAAAVVGAVALGAAVAM